MLFLDSTLRDFLTLFSVNRLSLGSYPLQKVLRLPSRGLKRFKQANRIGKHRGTSPTTMTSATILQLFLMEGRTYSLCAYFPNDNETLEQANEIS